MLVVIERSKPRKRYPWLHLYEQNDRSLDRCPITELNMFLFFFVFRSIDQAQQKAWRAEMLE